MLVQVTSGTINHDCVQYTVGESFHVSEERAARFEKLKVAKIIGKPVQEEQPVVVEPVVETTEQVVKQSAGPDMVVDEAPFEKKKNKKRGKRRG